MKKNNEDRLIYVFQKSPRAGRQLSQLLKKYNNTPVVVYALPRGAVFVAVELSRFLHAPTDGSGWGKNLHQVSSAMDS